MLWLLISSAFGKALLMSTYNICFSVLINETELTDWKKKKGDDLHKLLAIYQILYHITLCNVYMWT